jgi:pimeloyl-ACP methyl ester carboxylesterase
MAHRVTRHFVNVNGRQVHYRRVGEGPPVLMVHESPTTGVMLLPLARQLADLGYTAMTLDTPGYGASDRLIGVPHPSIADYADGVVETMNAMGLKRPHVYGSHTGAQIVLELGLRHPRATRSLVIDGLPAFTRAESIELRMNWLPQYTPHPSGAHLIALWHRYRDHTMFWPFYRPQGDSRNAIDMPNAQHIHDRIVDWLLPGADYPASYHAAFDYDGHLGLSELKARAALTAHHDDLLGFFMDRLPERLGRRTEAARMPKAQHARWIARFFGKEKGPDAPPPSAPAPLANRAIRTYATDGARQLLVRRRGDSSARPLVMLPAAPDSGSGLRDLMTRLAENRPVYTIDLPGTGGSDELRSRQPTIEEFATSVLRGVRSLDLTSFDLYGAGAGAVVALALASAKPKLVGRLILEDVALPSKAESQELRKHADQTITPVTDGTHLVQAWTFVRDHELYAPWFDRTKGAIRHVTPASPDEIQRRTLEVLKSPTTFWLPTRAALDYPIEESLKESTAADVMVCATSDSAAASSLPRAGRAAKTQPTTFATSDERADSIDDFLKGN